MRSFALAICVVLLIPGAAQALEFGDRWDFKVVQANGGQSTISQNSPSVPTTVKTIKVPPVVEEDEDEDDDAADAADAEVQDPLVARFAHCKGDQDCIASEARRWAMSRDVKRDKVAQQAATLQLLEGVAGLARAKAEEIATDQAGVDSELAKAIEAMKVDIIALTKDSKQIRAHLYQHLNDDPPAAAPSAQANPPATASMFPSPGPDKSR